MTSRALFIVVLCAACSADELSEIDQDLINDRNPTLAAGLSHSCAVASDGSVQCWGRNNYGQLGNGTLVDSAAPVTVAGIATAVMVSAGDYHTCAVLANGTVRCWGLGSSGQLGTGGTANRTTPGTVGGLAGVTSVAAGGAHTCASLDTGEARCWGSGTYGQLGNNATANATTPQPVLVHPDKVNVAPLAGVVEVDAGKYATCARLSGGGVTCWGRNNYGQLGDGSTATQRAWASAVASLSGAVDISVGDYHACAVIGNGRARCWGMNLLGQLGDGTQTARATPVEVQRRIAPDLTYPIVNVTSITAGFDHTCMRSAGEVWCTGRNDSGQLGRDITPYLELLAVQTSPVVLASEVAAGAQHTCARLTTGRVICFGDDAYGQVGTAARCPAHPTVAITGVRSATLATVFPTVTYRSVLAKQSDTLYYTDGHDLDIDLATTACAQVSDVVWKYGSIGGPGDPVEPGSGQSYEIVSSVDHDDGTRAITVRVHFQNPGTGTTYPTAVTVRSPADNTASAGFTLAEAASINASGGQIDITRDQVMNEVMSALYDKFGDSNYLVRNGVNIYDFDYAYFDLQMDPSGVWFRAKARADLISGNDPTDGCNPWVYIDGTFRIVLDSSGNPTHEWVEYPASYVDWPNLCSVVTLGLTDIIDLFAEIAADNAIAHRIEDKIAGLSSYCGSIGCSPLRSVTHVDGGVRVTVNDLFPSVTYRVPYNSDLQGHGGIGLPADEPVIVVSGGAVQACYAKSDCATPHRFGAAGLFNWTWAPYDPHQPPDSDPHPPIPDPWANGGFYAGRQGPWLRQLGLYRDVTQMWLWRHNPGGLLGRITRADNTQTAAYFLGDQVCSLPATGGASAMLGVGRNDLRDAQGPWAGQYGTGDAIVTIDFALGLSSSLPACSY